MKNLPQNFDEFCAYAIALTVMITTVALPASLVGYAFLSQRSEASQMVQPDNQNL
jgi:hypothetical protein